jgi:hypothetical protein
MANVILIRAVNNNETSRPFQIHLTQERDLPKQFVLRIDPTVNNKGEDRLKVNNINLNLISNHDPDWLSEVLTGFRRDEGDVVYIIAERAVENMPAINKLAKQEAY